MQETKTDLFDFDSDNDLFRTPEEQEDLFPDFNPPTPTNQNRKNNEQENEN